MSNTIRNDGQNNRIGNAKTNHAAAQRPAAPPPAAESGVAAPKDSGHEIRNFKKFKDGKTLTEYSNGSYLMKSPNGTEMSRDASGNITISLANGFVVEHNKGKKPRFYQPSSGEYSPAQAKMDPKSGTMLYIFKVPDDAKYIINSSTLEFEANISSPGGVLREVHTNDGLIHNILKGKQDSGVTGVKGSAGVMNVSVSPDGNIKEASSFSEVKEKPAPSILTAAQQVQVNKAGIGQNLLISSDYKNIQMIDELTQLTTPRDLFSNANSPSASAESADGSALLGNSLNNKYNSILKSVMEPSPESNQAGEFLIGAGNHPGMVKENQLANIPKIPGNVNQVTYSQGSDTAQAQASGFEDPPIMDSSQIQNGGITTSTNSNNSGKEKKVVVDNGLNYYKSEGGMMRVGLPSMNGVNQIIDGPDMKPKVIDHRCPAMDLKAYKRNVPTNDGRDVQTEYSYRDPLNNVVRFYDKDLNFSLKSKDGKVFQNIHPNGDIDILVQTGTGDINTKNRTLRKIAISADGRVKTDGAGGYLGINHDCVGYNINGTQKVYRFPEPIPKEQGWMVGFTETLESATKTDSSGPGESILPPIGSKLPQPGEQPAQPGQSGRAGENDPSEHNAGTEPSAPGTAPEVPGQNTDTGVEKPIDSSLWGKMKKTLGDIGHKVNDSLHGFMDFMNPFPKQVFGSDNKGGQNVFGPNAMLGGGVGPEALFNSSKMSMNFMNILLLFGMLSFPLGMFTGIGGGLGSPTFF